MEPTHYIFVDFENVPSVNLDLIIGKPVRIILVLGSKQTKVPLELVEKLMKHSSQVRIVKTEVSGKNALDFVLACEAGIQSAADPDGSFHIVSKDTGFDALVLHLRHRHHHVARHADFSRIPQLAGPKPVAQAPAGPPQNTMAKSNKTAAIPSLDERVRKMTQRVARNQNNRPKRRQTLLSHINNHFGDKLTEGQLQATLDKLVSEKVITITPAGAVLYH